MFQELYIQLSSSVDMAQNQKCMYVYIYLTSFCDDLGKYHDNFLDHFCHIFPLLAFWT